MSSVALQPVETFQGIFTRSFGTSGSRDPDPPSVVSRRSGKLEVCVLACRMRYPSNNGNAKRDHSFSCREKVCFRHYHGWPLRHHDWHGLHALGQGPVELTY